MYLDISITHADEQQFTHFGNSFLREHKSHMTEANYQFKIQVWADRV